MGVGHANLERLVDTVRASQNNVVEHIDSVAGNVGAEDTAHAVAGTQVPDLNVATGGCGCGGRQLCPTTHTRPLRRTCTVVSHPPLTSSRADPGTNFKEKTRLEWPTVTCGMLMVSPPGRALVRGANAGWQA